MPTQTREFWGGQKKPTNTPDGDQNQGESGEYASRSFSIEPQYAEAPGLNVLEKMPANQVPRDHKEYVDARKPAGKRLWKRVIHENRHDGKRAQTLYVVSNAAAACGASHRRIRRHNPRFEIDHTAQEVIEVTICATVSMRIGPTFFALRPQVVVEESFDRGVRMSPITLSREAMLRPGVNHDIKEFA